MVIRARERGNQRRRVANPGLDAELILLISHFHPVEPKSVQPDFVGRLLIAKRCSLAGGHGQRTA